MPKREITVNVSIKVCVKMVQDVSMSIDVSVATS